MKEGVVAHPSENPMALSPSASVNAALFLLRRCLLGGGLLGRRLLRCGLGRRLLRCCFLGWH